MYNFFAPVVGGGSGSSVVVLGGGSGVQSEISACVGKCYSEV